MTTAPPRAVLSERLEERIASRRVRSAVFLTYSFDPGFFEQEILPALFDRGFSHEPAVRLIQLEEVLRDQVDHVAVYYDRGALEAGAASAKLDVRRIPMAWPTGYFHPKIVLLLLEDWPEPEGETGPPERSLLVGVASANLTRSGWWENVEVAHFEEIEEGGVSSLRSDLLEVLRRVRAAAPTGADQSALESIRTFLVRLSEPAYRSTKGVLHARIWSGQVPSGGSGRATFAEFLTALVASPRRPRFEVISPFVEEGEETGPLRDLIEALDPEEVRIFLPREPDGTPRVSRTTYDRIRDLPGVSWSTLPPDLLRSGNSEQAAPRNVHAKVYRIFHARPKFELIFLGSVNLTLPAHSAAGNFESGILLDLEPDRVPDWWLEPIPGKPKQFPEPSELDEPRPGPGIALALTFDWASGSAEACWSGSSPSPRLRLDAQGSPLFDLDTLAPGVSTRLPEQQAAELRRILPFTSLLTVRIEGEDDAVILVQEEGMAARPSILLNLTVAEILRYWAELNDTQKAVLLEEHYGRLTPNLSVLMPRTPLGTIEKRSIFDSFAGIFHAFGTLERGVWRALAEGREKEAIYRILGRKHDSLPHLVERVLGEDSQLDEVERYVLLLCARQLLDRLQREDPSGFASEHRRELAELGSRIAEVASTRATLAGRIGAEGEKLLAWYERWFLRRATPKTEAGS